MMDREVEVDELNEKLEAQEISFDRIEEGSTYDDTFLPIPVLPPPPPPVVGKAYVQVRLSLYYSNLGSKLRFIRYFVYKYLFLENCNNNLIAS